MLANLFIDLFIQGGPIMWPILACLFAALAVVIERTVWWLRLRKLADKKALDPTFQAISRGDFQSAIDLSADSRNPFLSTIHDGLLNARSSLLGAMQLRASEILEQAERRQWVLGTLITLTPLLGLLGTVTGIMGSFNFVGDGQLAAAKVTGGIAEALIATAAGLGIAILCLIPYNWYNRCIQSLRSRLERTINHTELLAESAKLHGHDIEAFQPANQAE